MKNIFFAAALCAGVLGGDMIGGFANADCRRDEMGTRFPGHAINHAIRFMSSLPRQQTLKLIYYAHNAVAGTVSRTVFSINEKDIADVQYIAIEVYTRLAMSRHAPTVTRMIVTQELSEIAHFFQMKEAELKVEERCSANLLDQINTFNLEHEMQIEANTMYDHSGKPRQPVQFKDSYHLFPHVVSRAFDNSVKPFAETQNVVQKLSRMLRTATQAMKGPQLTKAVSRNAGEGIILEEPYEEVEMITPPETKGVIIDPIVKMPEIEDAAQAVVDAYVTPTVFGTDEVGVEGLSFEENEAVLIPKEDITLLQNGKTTNAKAEAALNDASFSLDNESNRETEDILVPIKSIVIEEKIPSRLLHRHK